MTELHAAAPRRAVRALAFALFLAAAPLAFAQDVPAPRVLVTIDGEPITDADLALAIGEFEDQLGQLPPQQRSQAVLDLLINIRLAGKAAVASGLDKTPLVAQRLEMARNRTLYSEFLRKAFGAAITEENVRKKYDEEIAKFVPQDQIRASHILVETEDEAKAIIADLDKGGDFAAIAKEKSKDPGSGANGGDLGFFGKGMMVPTFEEAAFALPVGSYSRTPVKSDFGFHVIKVVEVGKSSPPAFEQEGARIQQDLVRETFEKEIGALRAAAKIEIMPALAPDAAPAPGAPANPAATPKPAQ